jgi:hypothetical protein
MKRVNTVLKSRPTDEGFGLPVAVGFSLVALVISLTVIGRAFKDNNISAAQKTTSRSLYAAEAGVTRYLALINSDRYLAKYSSTDATGQPSWENTTTIPRGGCPGSTSTTSITPNQIAGVWQDLDSTKPQKGQYRLISYTKPNAAISGDTGKLRVEGRINQVGSGSTASRGLATSTTQLQVEIPVTANSSTSSHPEVGLWVNQVPTPGNGKLDADVLQCGAATTPVTSTYQTNTTTGPYKFRKAPMAVPSLPPRPTIPPQNIIGSINGDMTLPKGGDIATTETINGVQTKIYRYAVGSISLSGQNKLSINTVNTIKPFSPSGSPSPSSTTLPQKVIFYLDDNATVDVTGKAGIINNCINTDNTLGIPCNINNFQINAYGNDPNNKICVSGNGTTYAFINAPGYTVGVNGGGAVDGAIYGAVWAKVWGGGCSNGNHLHLNQNGSDWANLAPFLPPLTSEPLLGSIRNWKILPSSN